MLIYGEMQISDILWGEHLSYVTGASWRQLTGNWIVCCLAFSGSKQISTSNIPFTVPMSWWRHHMETISALLAICAGMFSSICARINGWVNNGDAGDLRCHRAHYNIIVMKRGMRKAFLCHGAIVNSMRMNYICIFTIHHAVMQGWYFIIKVKHHEKPFCLLNSRQDRIFVLVAHYSDIMMRAMGSQISGVLIICSTVCSGPDHR